MCRKHVRKHGVSSLIRLALICDHTNVLLSALNLAQGGGPLAPFLYDKLMHVQSDWEDPLKTTVLAADRRGHEEDPQHCAQPLQKAIGCNLECARCVEGTFQEGSEATGVLAAAPGSQSAKFE